MGSAERWTATGALRRGGTLWAWLAGALLTLASVSALPAPALATCMEIAGDLNGSGEADVGDVQCSILSVVTLLAHGGDQAVSTPACLAGGDWARADMDCDGLVNVVDSVLTIKLALSLFLDPAIDTDQNGCVDTCQPVECGDGLCFATQGENCVDCPGDCGLCSGDCCAKNGTIGCQQPLCQACVCGKDPFCCGVSWDQHCSSCARGGTTGSGVDCSASSQDDCGAACGCVEEPACDDDSFEPNDLVSDAAVFEGDMVVEGTLCPQNRDHYELDLGAGCRGKIDLDSVSGGAALRLTVLSSAGELEVELDGAEALEAMEFDPPYPGEWIVRVHAEGQSDPLEYSLSLSEECAAGPGCPTDDGFEPNDDSSEAVLLSPNPTESYQAVLCGEDRDVYALMIPEQCLLTIEVSSGFESSPMDISLRSSAGDLFALSDSTSGFPELTRFALVSEEVEIHVEGAGGNTQPYTLDVDILCDLSPFSCPIAPNNCDEAGAGPGCDSSSCCELICPMDSYCCDVQWDDICAARAADICSP